MPKGKLVVCGNFEWWSEKNDLNKINHKDKNNKGIGFEDILDVFNEAYFDVCRSAAPWRTRCVHKLPP